MNRLYNNEAIIMACMVHLLKLEVMDIAKIYLCTTLLVDSQLCAFVKRAKDLDQLCKYVREQGLISRKLQTFGPYFLNAITILKQNNFILVSDGNLLLGCSRFPEGDLQSSRLKNIIRNSEHFLAICSGVPTKELYNNLNIQL